MKNQPAALDYGSVQIGQKFSFERRFTHDDILTFAKLTGDHNPLHVEASYAKSQKFSGNVVHGMLAASLFSTLIGMFCPGKRALYLSQSLEFRKPIYPDQTLKVEGVVLAKSDSTQVISLSTIIWNQNDKVVTGEAKAKFLGGESL